MSADPGPAAPNAVKINLVDGNHVLVKGDLSQFETAPDRDLPSSGMERVTDTFNRDTAFNWAHVVSIEPCTVADTGSQDYGRASW